MTAKKLILIVAPPGDLQIGLQALLAVLPDVEVLVAAEGQVALEVVEKHDPSLVIMDSDLPGNGAPLLASQVKTRWPDVRCLVLVDDEAQKQKLQSAGADIVLTSGYPAAKLIATVEALLSRDEGEASLQTGTTSAE